MKLSKPLETYSLSEHKIENALLDNQNSEEDALNKFAKLLINELTNNPKEIVCLFDQTGKILIINDYGKKYLYGKRDIFGNYYIQKNFLAPDVRDEFDIYISLVIREKQSKDFVKVLSSQDKERILEFEIQLHTFQDFTFIKGVALDVTKRWKQNKKLKAPERFYTKIFNNSSASIFIFNRDEIIIDINKAATKAYNYEKNEIIGKSAKYFCEVFNCDNKELSKAFEFAWDDKIPSLQWKGKDKSGKEIFKDAVLKKSTYANQDVLIYLDRDLTEPRIVPSEIILNNGEYKILTDPFMKNTFSPENENVEGISTDEIKLYTNETLKCISTSKNVENILEKALHKIIDLVKIESAGIYYLSESKKSFHLKYFISIPNDLKKEIQEIKYSNKTLRSLFQEIGNVEIKNIKEIFPKYKNEDRQLLFIPLEVEKDYKVIYLFLMDHLTGKELLLLNYLTKEINNYLLKLALTNQLIQSENKYKALFENASDGVVLMNENGFIDCNNKNLEIFRCDKEAFLNASINDLFPNVYPDCQPSQNFNLILKDALLGKPQFLFWQNIRFDDSLFHSEISLTRIEIDDQYFILAFIRDITEKKKAEKEIMEKDILFKTLADNAPVLLRMTDDKNKFYYFNKPWLYFTGRKLKDEQNNGWTSNLHAEDIAPTIETINASIKSRKRFEITYRLKRFDGTFRWILDKGTPYTDTDNNFIGYISSAIDITERKIAEEELRKEEAALESLYKLQTALEGAHLLAVTINNKGTITFCNKFLLRITGFSNEDLINKNIFEVLFIDKDKSTDKIDFLHIIEAWTLSENNEAIIRTKHLPFISIRFNSTIITNSKGQVVGLTIVAEDITERKKVMQELEESEEKFRNIYESFQDLYFQCDLNGYIKMVSPSVLELIGYSQEDVINKNITDYYLYSKRTKDLIKQLLEKGRVRNFEASLINKEGKIIQFICNVRLLNNRRKRPFAIEGVARDITEIKKATEELFIAKEVAEKSLAVKERFLANMSHEIRTPMNGIIGMIDLVSGTPLNEEQKDYIQTVKKSSETLLNILNDILDLSKIEAGKMELRESPIKLEALLEKLYALFSQQAYAKNLTLYYYYDKKLPEYVLADETRLLQVLSNLTSNAIKFTEGGGSVNIGIRKVSEKEDGKILVRVDVKDSGIGISKEHQKLLFTSFTQVDNSTTKNYGGTGLGLVISKELAKLMNGNIGVFSTLGLGSTFWFTFETEAADKPIEKAKPEKREGFAGFNHFGGAQPKILIVDDNQINQKVASEILSKSGCKIEVASNGLQAIEKVKNNEYDLIFMDIQMPEMDGVTATIEIRKLGLKNVPPILAMTAYSMKEDRDRFLNMGMDDYIAKPIKANVLIDKVKEWYPILNTIETKGKNIPVPEQKEPVIDITPKENLIDPEVIQQLAKYGGADMIQKIYEEFVEETESHIKECQESLKESDINNILSVLHTLKGNAGTLGIEKLANFAKLLEDKLKKGIQDNLGEELISLQEIFTEFKLSYNQFLTKSI